MKTRYAATRRGLLWLAAAAFAVVGCAEDPANPSLETPPPFYPLDVGNRWQYDYTLLLHFYNDDTGGLIEADTLHGVGIVELTGEETIVDVLYVVERTIVVAASSDTSWIRLRQDAAGLYRALVPTNLPPASAAAAPVELRRLQYPLFVGAEWTLYEGPPVIDAAVESVDTLETPAGKLIAYRVRVVQSDDGPDDYNDRWYNDSGKVREVRHSEIVGVDPGSGTRVRIVTDEIEVVRQIHLGP